MAGERQPGERTRQVAAGIQGQVGQEFLRRVARIRSRARGAPYQRQEYRPGLLSTMSRAAPASRATRALSSPAIVPAPRVPVQPGHGRIQARVTAAAYPPVAGCAYPAGSPAGTQWAKPSRAMAADW